MSSNNGRPLHGKVLKGLKSVLERFAISGGDRGEFLVFLLMTLARDETVGPHDGWPPGGQESLVQLVLILVWIGREQIRPSSYVDAQTISALETLEAYFPHVYFPHAYLHFNHFVQIHKEKAEGLASFASKAKLGSVPSSSTSSTS